MKNLNILKAITLFSAIIFLQAFSTTEVKAAECSRTNGEIDASNFSSSGTCTVTPDVAMFPIHKIGLCEEVPNYENYLTNCKFLLEYSSPKDIEVSKNTIVELNNSITLDEGTYKAAVLVIGNTIGLKHSDIFATSHNGNEVDGDEFNVSQGKYCSTRAYTGNLDMFDSANGGVSEGEVATLESFLDCSDEALTAGLYKEDKGAYEASTLCTLNSSDEVVAPSALTTTNSTVGKVQICAMATNGTTPAQPGVKQLAIQTLPSSVIINANTSTIDIGFELTNMLLFEQHNANGTLSGGSITSFTFTNAFVESVGLKITTN